MKPARADVKLARADALGLVRLDAAFYARPVLEVARELIGCVVEHEGVAGRIVETEAYHESEPACHAFVGVTQRTRILFGAPGTAYVYRSYGIHALLNAVCEPVGVGAAVLIRALEPLHGLELMRARRESAARTRLRERELCSGPGKLTQALGVELRENGTSLIDGPVAIYGSGEPRSGAANAKRTTRRRPAKPSSGDAATALREKSPSVVVGTRIGITKAVELRWRFCAEGNAHVSRPWPNGEG